VADPGELDALRNLLQRSLGGRRPLASLDMTADHKLVLSVEPENLDAFTRAARKHGVPLTSTGVVSGILGTGDAAVLMTLSQVPEPVSAVVLAETLIALAHAVDLDPRAPYAQLLAAPSPTRARSDAAATAGAPNTAPGRENKDEEALARYLDREATARLAGRPLGEVPTVTDPAVQVLTQLLADAGCAGAYVAAGEPQLRDAARIAAANAPLARTAQALAAEQSANAQASPVQHADEAAVDASRGVTRRGRADEAAGRRQPLSPGR
jgi:hypothetical protein